MADVRELNCIKVFRAKLVELLKAKNIDGIGENVYPCRVEKFWPEESGIIVLTIPQVNFSDNRTSPRFYTATADLMLDIISGQTSERESVSSMADWLDDKAQVVCELLELTTSRKGPFDGIVKRCSLKSFTNNLSEQEMVRGAMRIVFGIEFAVCINHSAPTDEFLKAENTLTMGDGDGNKQEFVTNLRP